MRCWSTAATWADLLVHMEKVNHPDDLGEPQVRASLAWRDQPLGPEDDREKLLRKNVIVVLTGLLSNGIIPDQ